MDNPQHFESLYPETARSEEIAKIISLVKVGSSCQLIGIPGAGRNNVMALLAFNKSVRLKHLQDLQEWFHFVYMDFSEVKKRSLHEVIKFILISLAYSLLERKMQEEYETINTYLKEAVEFQDELIMFQALKKSIDYLAIEKQLTVVLLFDRFEQYIPVIEEQFFSNLKILRNRAKYRFSCVFSLNRPIEDLLDTSIYAEYYEFLSGNIVYLNLYDKEGIDFRISYLEKTTGKKIDDSTKKEVLSLTSGHGKLTRVSFESILAESSEKNHPKIKSQTKNALQDLLLSKNTVKGALFEIWNALTTEEQTTLKHIVKNESDEIEKYLTNTHLIKDDKIQIPLFEEFIKETASSTPQTLTYNQEKNEITKGNSSITETLSPSEFKLLRFLLTNPDRICEKDEIIQSVWKDSKTQEGVTDQALDQIIYRLRKKIEEDPNNPTHLITIKGRGFKFQP